MSYEIYARYRYVIEVYGADGRREQTVCLQDDESAKKVVRIAKRDGKRAVVIKGPIEQEEQAE